MQGKTVVITGGTSGIGEVAAVALAKMGARIVLVGRDRSRCDGTLGRLRSSAPGLAHSAYFAELSRLADMKRVAAEIADQEPRIDVLINNAGAIFSTRQLTEDGLERASACRSTIREIFIGGLPPGLHKNRHALTSRQCRTPSS
jgi:NAD(P)-dependent dehydrogenase (short-subunit alcohol dehydrogenase family)